MSETSIKLWDAKSCQLKSTIKFENRISSAIISSDGRYVITIPIEGDSLTMMDIQTQKSFFGLVHHGVSLDPGAFSPDGNMVLTCSWRDSTIKFWDSHTR